MPSPQPEYHFLAWVLHFRPLRLCSPCNVPGALVTWLVSSQLTREYGYPEAPGTAARLVLHLFLRATTSSTRNTLRPQGIPAALQEGKLQPH